MKAWWDQARRIANQYQELTARMADPAVFQDPERYRAVAKEAAEYEPVATKFAEYEKTARELEDVKQLLTDRNSAELRDLAAEEAEQLEQRLARLEAEIKELLTPRDPNDERNVFLEVRAGTGGEEAALFAADLVRMYTRYAERQGWRAELVDASPTELGGFKEAVLLLEGKGAYSRLKYESGVHRVQRVPITEASGRIHTSTATVAVLPEAEEVEVTINPEDLRIDVFRSTGHGGQSVNTTDSAVRITHIPTGIVVTCQDERSQLKNKEKALRVLRARLLERAREQQRSEIDAARRSQVGTGERSERIRTYNFPQGRVTDHRIGLTLYRLEQFLDGDLDEMIEALRLAAQSRNSGTSSPAAPPAESPRAVQA
ncbi:MAG: peptide chain release factor 1 [Limnochordales bacterium]|nr:peptide chain release factor 1 [Limnochordales bacterium]